MTRVKVNERKRQDETSWVGKKAEKTQKYKIRKDRIRVERKSRKRRKNLFIKNLCYRLKINSLQ